MKLSVFLGASLAGALFCGCQQYHPHYEKHPYASMIPGMDVQSWISPRDLPDVTKRASKGNLACTVMLARYYLYTIKDRESGIRWLRAAATQGDHASKWNMSFHLLRSTDPTERAEGMGWLRAAAADGDQMALRELRRREKEPNQSPEPMAPSGRGSS